MLPSSLAEGSHELSTGTRLRPACREGGGRERAAHPRARCLRRGQARRLAGHDCRQRERASHSRGHRAQVPGRRHPGRRRRVQSRFERTAMDHRSDRRHARLVRGNRFWCVLVALEEAGESLVGVAHFPMLDETYWSVRGEGSYLQDERLHVSAVDAIAACSFSPNGLHLAQARPHLHASDGPDAALLVRPLVRRGAGRLPAGGRQTRDLVRA